MNKRLNILVANDDGIASPGLLRLANAAARLGDVWVAAPAGQCSGMSQKVTIAGEISVEKRNFPADVKAAYAIGGTPADCAKLGMHFTACTTKKYFPDAELVKTCEALAKALSELL